MSTYNFIINQETIIGDYFNHGAYGDLFKIYDGKCLLKIFRKRETEYENFIAENACRSEILAYRRLQHNGELSRMAPCFSGPAEVERIYQNENEINNNYLLSSAYIIEFIDNSFKKVGFDTAAKKEIKKFNEVGVNYLEDADFCLTKTGFVFIDFAVVGVREEIERIEYLNLPCKDKFKLFYEKNPFLALERL